MTNPGEALAPIPLARGAAPSGRPLNVYGDLVYIKLSGEETGGRLAVMEDHVPAGQGPPLHVHHREAEIFYVLEGDFEFEVAGRGFQASAGDFFYVRRDIPHTFRNAGAGTGRLLITVEPAGLENFFAEIAAAPGPPDPAGAAEIFAKYGLELLGPPLALR
ncbi:MAG: cupin domain-containing protein [Acidobacteria bacterium]|nr:cupin domain-containing protein [Acidobacteriota bacterium]